MSNVVTANALATGKVVFVGADGGWVESLDEARMFEDADAAEAALETAQGDVAKAIIVEPFVAKAGPVRDGRPTMTLRDTIRAFGPTIDFSAGGKDRSKKNA